MFIMYNNKHLFLTANFYNFQENIRMECELSPEGVQKCDEQHKITIDYTIAATDQCPYQAKCDCKLVEDVRLHMY